MAFRRKLTKEERQAIVDEIAEARVTSARYEQRDGREFLVVTLPDRYGEHGPTGGTGDTAEKLDTLVDAE